MKNLFLLICFIGISTFSLGQNESAAPVETIKTIEPLKKGDFTLSGNINYLKNNNGGTIIFNSLPSDISSAFSAELRPQVLLGKGISLGVILGYSSLETEDEYYYYYGYSSYQIRISTFYYGLTSRIYFPIFPRTYAFIGVDAFTGLVKRENLEDDPYYGQFPPQIDSEPRFFQGSFNPGFSFFISPLVILELKYGRLGATVIEDDTSAFAEFDFNSLALGVTLRF